MMRKALGLVALVVLSLTAAPTPSVAHHALAAEFDFAKRGEFTGVLTKFAIINPHVRWYFDVKKPDGTTVKWELTAGSPSTLRDNGLLRIFTLGTTYKVTYMRVISARLVRVAHSILHVRPEAGGPVSVTRREGSDRESLGPTARRHPAA